MALTSVCLLVGVIHDRAVSSTCFHHVHLYVEHGQTDHAPAAPFRIEQSHLVYLGVHPMTVCLVGQYLQSRSRVQGIRSPSECLQVLPREVVLVTPALTPYGRRSYCEDLVTFFGGGRKASIEHGGGNISLKRLKRIAS